MRFLFIFATLLAFSLQAQAGQLNLAIGASVPEAQDTYVLAHGPSRAGGGEKFLVTFAAPKTLSLIKITAFSKGRAGKALIHNAVGTSAGTKVALEGLSKFARVGAGNPTNYNGKVMLTDSAYVEVAPNQAFTQLELTVEGFTNDDASILVQITSTEDIQIHDFLATRTGSAKNESAGALVDETRYAQFSPQQLSGLMSRARIPAVQEIGGKAYSCTSVTKLNPRQVDFKKRAYNVNASGALQSESDLEGATKTWSTTATGVVLSIENVNGCGRYNSYNVVRMTPSGALISEVVTHLEDYVKLCVSVGYDEAAVRAVESNSTFASSIDPKYVVDSYEYCRPL
ncbi:MAG: hypothetical protein KF681_17110 [Bdellovibrionaceae bacterium]|nr:hypothetical protein [Pseudobdellovibrionaceae bacterium]